MFGKAGYALRTLSTLKGLPIHEESGKLLGHICDLVLSEAGYVEGLLMKRKALFRKLRLIPLGGIASIDQDGVTVGDAARILAFNHDKYVTLQHQRAIANKMMINGHGENLGLLDDVYFSESKGTIVAYEISNGFFSDITEGKRMIHTPEPLSLAKDAIVIS